MFAYLRLLNRQIQMQLFCWRFKDKIMNEVVAHDNKVTFD